VLSQRLRPARVRCSFRSSRNPHAVAPALRATTGLMHCSMPQRKIIRSPRRRDQAARAGASCRAISLVDARDGVFWRKPLIRNRKGFLTSYMAHRDRLRGWGERTRTQISGREPQRWIGAIQPSDKAGPYPSVIRAHHARPSEKQKHFHWLTSRQFRGLLFWIL
jgi:hypothetical protein